MKRILLLCLLASGCGSPTQPSVAECQRRDTGTLALTNRANDLGTRGILVNSVDFGSVSYDRTVTLTLNSGVYVVTVFDTGTRAETQDPAVIRVVQCQASNQVIQ